MVRENRLLALYKEMPDMKTNARLALLAALGLAVSGCTQVSYSQRPIAQRPQGIEGLWVDPNGIVSSFNSGRFETRTTDTNTLMAEGNYRYVSPRYVEIDLTSLVRGTTSRVNCALATQSQLNCTSSSGAQFSLVRRA